MAAVNVSALAWVWDWTPFTLAVGAGLCVIIWYQGWRIYPHLPLASPEVLDARGTHSAVHFSILTANVLQQNRQADDFIDVVRKFDPDVFLAIETDEWWETALGALSGEYPNVVSYPLDTTYGMILGSRYELVQPRVRFLVEDEIPSIRTYVCLPNSQPVSLHALHPDPPNPQYATETTERDAELLIAGREAKAYDGPAVVAGDFNDVSWSPTTRLFRSVSGLVDPRVGRGFYNTYHADWPLLRWPVDHVYHSTHFRLKALERGRHIGSDHFPMYAELELDSNATLKQSEPVPTQEERDVTKEKILDAQHSTGQRTEE